MNLNAPYYRFEGSEYVLYKPDFVLAAPPEASGHSFVDGGAPHIVGRFDTLEALQEESVKQFGVEAAKAD